MKKIFIMILSCILLSVGILGCGKKDAGHPKTWYENMDWSSLTKKDELEMLMFNKYKYPYSLSDMKDDIAFTSDDCYKENGEKLQSVDDVESFMNVYTTAFQCPETSFFIKEKTFDSLTNKEINNVINDEVKFIITSEYEEGAIVNIAKAIENGEYYFYNDTAPNKLLGIDLSDIEDEKENPVLNNRLSTNKAKAFLDRMIKKFGKPSENKLINDAKMDDLKMQSYDLVWEFKDYVILIHVQENIELDKASMEQVDYNIRIGSSVYTKVSWKQCENERKVQQK